MPIHSQLELRLRLQVPHRRDETFPATKRYQRCFLSVPQNTQLPNVVLVPDCEMRADRRQNPFLFASIVFVLEESANFHTSHRV